MPGCEPGRGRDGVTARWSAGTVNPETTAADVMALIWAMRGLVQSDGEVGPHAWQRFLDIHLAGLRAPGPASGTAAQSPGR